MQLRTSLSVPHNLLVKLNGLNNLFSYILGFHTMLPRSSDTGNGVISWWQWIKIGWNYKNTPQFNPLKVADSNINLCTY